MSVSWTVAPCWPQMLLNHGEVSGSCAELQSVIDDFTGAARLDFFEALLSDELVENSSKGW